MRIKIVEFFQIFLVDNPNHRYNKVMSEITINNLMVRPDPKTGKLPTTKQLQLLLVLNPFRRKKKVTYKQAAILLGITDCAVASRMRGFQKRCPILYANYCVARYPRKHKRPKKVIHEAGCPDCGCDIPDNQEFCFRCWRTRDRKYNPNNYKQDSMFPANGVTKNTINWDKWEDNDYHCQNRARSLRRRF